eukprot:239343_1
MSHRSSFGVDLNASSYELHPSHKDTTDTLQGNYCSTIRFSDNLSTQISDFVHNHQCHDGMQIGTVQFIADNRGKISFKTINPTLTNCTVTVTKESTINTEVYETEYDRPPSNAMFLRRKGFVHSKLIIKPALQNDRSIKMRNPIAQPRATTTFKQVKGTQRLNMKQRNNKRRMGQTQGPPHKRLKPNTTLSKAVREILCIGDATLDTVRKILTSRTSIRVTIDELQSTLTQLAQLCEGHYRINPNIARTVDWRNSSVLTESEKQKIMKRDINRTNTQQIKSAKPLSIDEQYERDYGPIRDQNAYSNYNSIYQEKLNKRTTFLKSVNDNQTYFKQMRALIKGETDTTKKGIMMKQFRTIFEGRTANIKEMRDQANKLGTELNVIKKRMDGYVEEQRQRQMHK